MSKERYSKERYYQYLKGDNVGNVTTLDFIDDSDPEMTIFNFKDGFKCNQDLIAKINDKNAFNSPAILAEVESPNNIWTISKHEASPDNKKVYTKDGQQVEIVDPYFFNKDGSSIHQKTSKMTAAPPKPTRVTLPDLKTFYVSYVPEEDEENEKQEDIQEVKQEEPVLEEFSSTLIEKPTTATIKCIKPKQSNGPIDIDKLDEGEVEYSKDDKTVKLNSKEIFEKAFDKKIQEEEFNNSPISIMLKNCKKKNIEIGLKLGMSLPDKSIYQVIKSNFPEGWDLSFIKKVVNDIDVDDIRNSLISSLKDFYDKEIELQQVDNK